MLYGFSCSSQSISGEADQGGQCLRSGGGVSRGDPWRLEAREMKSRLVFPLAVGVCGFVILVSLGLWQTQRLQWKLEIIARIEHAIAENPVKLPEFPDEQHHNYLPVVLDGRIDGDELMVLTSRQGLGPGHRVISVLESRGRRVLLDLGFLPDGRKGEGERTGVVSVLGNLHWPDEVDRVFTPEPDGRLWFARDVMAMAALMETEPALVVARRVEPRIHGVEPWPLDASGIRNEHLQYAVTWFSLSVVWLMMTMLWLKRLAGRGRA